MAVDPLMMYWNRDILATEGYLAPPQTWEVLVNEMFTDLIQRDFDRTINRSVVAFGGYDNVRNAFGIISALLIQGGTHGVIEDDRGNYEVRLQSSPSGNDPLRAAAEFYTQFSRPSNSLYSWNRSLPEDRQAFIAEDLAFYFGYGSEARLLERLNPNLSFDIAEIPQGATATVRRTYAKFYALSALASSDNPRGASRVMSRLMKRDFADELVLRSDLAPAYRNTAAAGSNDVYSRYTYQSAGIAKGWLNPDREAADSAFGIMTQDLNENRIGVIQAAWDATERLDDAYD
jgi:hypothetical protein